MLLLITPDSRLMNSIILLLNNLNLNNTSDGTQIALWSDLSYI